MNEILDLPSRPTYNPTSQAKLGLYAAMLDDQLKLLKKDIAELEVKHLEWQPTSGMNTIGMLLAHLAVVEVWWLHIACRRIVVEEDADRISIEIIGIRMDDDGLPAKEGASHPESIRGKTVQEYIVMLDNARTVTHQILQTWTDSEIDGIYKHPIRDRQYSINWTLYHVLEHFSGHYGQILLLKHLMRDAGVLARPDKK